MRIAPKVWESTTQVYAEDLLRGDLFLFPRENLAEAGFCQIKDVDEECLHLLTYDFGSSVPKYIKFPFTAGEYIIVGTPMIHIRDGEIVKEYKTENHATNQT